MAREFEVKLEIPAATVGKVMRLPWLWELASGELQASRLASTYYDTPKYELRERGVTLRVRRVGAVRLQTMKAHIRGAALPIERDEWEEEISGDEPQLKLIAGSPLDGMSRKKLRRKLQPCFEVQVDRSAFPIQSANSAIEVAIDRATIVGPKPASFCEIELELKRGASSELARIARRIASEVPAALALSTKSERGFALQEKATPRPHEAEPLTIASTMRIGEAFQTIGWSCMRHVVLNKSAVQAADPHGVQQMLAGIGRLNAAITIFHRILDGPETDAIQAELDWLKHELTPAHELDTLLHQTLSAMRDAHIDPAALDLLSADVGNRLKVALERAREAVANDRSRQLFLRIALWLIAAEWSDSNESVRDEPNRRVAPFVHGALAGACVRALQLLKRFHKLTAPERGELLAALLAVQHAAAFFADTLPSKRAGQKGFARVLGKAITHLQRLSDIVVHERLHGDFMRAWTTEPAPLDSAIAQKAFAMGFAIGRHQEEKAHRAQSIARLAPRLATLAPR